MRTLLAVVSAGLASGLVGLAGLASVACGASYQAIYEGDVRFEHCYALEENPQKSMPEKSDCWRDWSEHYTYGQTRDRIQYAIARYVALSEARDAPTDEALMMAAPGVTPRETTITAPAPTNAFAPPPKTLAPQDGGTDAAFGPPAVTEAPAPAPYAAASSSPVPAVVPTPVASASAAPSLPASDCSKGCELAYRQCHTGCDGPYKTCMKSCFK